MNLFNIFRRQNLQFPSKFEFYTYNDWKFIKRVPVKSSGKTFFLETMPNGNRSSAVTIITDKRYNDYGMHDYDFYRIPSVLDGNNMEIQSEKRGLGLGELLRLASIVEMKENDIEKIAMKSMPSAMPFHIKYKLMPNINDTTDLENVLKKISLSDNSVGDFQQDAKKILNDISRNGIEQKHFKEVNSLAAKYIRANADRWKDTELDTSLPMCLTKSDVKKYASFYNELFKKHEIDYRI